MNRILVLYFITAILIYFLLLGSTYLGKLETITTKNEIYSLPLLDSIIRINGERHSVFNKTLKNKVVVINLWASWCKPCIAELPELSKIRSTYIDNKEIVFISINKEMEDPSKGFLTRKNIDFPYIQVYERQAEPTYNLLQSLNGGKSEKLPLNIIINKEGKISMLLIGNSKSKLDSLKTNIDELVNM